MFFSSSVTSSNGRVCFFLKSENTTVSRFLCQNQLNKNLKFGLCDWSSFNHQQKNYTVFNFCCNILSNDFSVNQELSIIELPSEWYNNKDLLRLTFSNDNNNKDKKTYHKYKIQLCDCNNAFECHSEEERKNNLIAKTFSNKTSEERREQTILSNGQLFKNINITSDLLLLLQQNLTLDTITQGLLNISKNYNKFSPFDVFLVGKIFYKIYSNGRVNLLIFTEIVSNLLEIDENVMIQSHNKFEATETLLKYVNKIIQNVEPEIFFLNVSSTNFLLQIFDVKKINTSGLVLFVENNTIYTKLLPKNANFSQIVKNKNFDSAVIFNSSAPRQASGSKIIISIFLKNVFFVNENVNNLFVNKIFNLHFQNTSISKATLYYKIPESADQRKCATWSYNTSSWESKDVETTNLSSVIRCNTWSDNQITILTINKNIEPDTVFNDIFFLIIEILSILSILGFVIIALTAILFRKWRQDTGNQILLNFVFAVLGQFVINFVADCVDIVSLDLPLCYMIGILYHFFLLAQFCWMFVFAVLQFRRFVIVLGGTYSNVLLKSCLFGWLVPLSFVVSLLIFDYKNYEQQCFPHGLGVVLSLLLPICIIAVCNFFIFLYICYSVFCKRAENNGNKNAILHEWRLAILLFFMLGINWMFVFLSMIYPKSIFSWLYMSTTSLQGLVLFLYFIVFNQKTRNLYLGMFKRLCRKK